MLHNVLFQEWCLSNTYFLTNYCSFNCHMYLVSVDMKDATSLLRRAVS